MTAPRGTPPGRAGRSWLLMRLRTAEHAAQLLEHKLTILRGEQRRQQLIADRTREAWERQCTDAQGWLLRGVLIGGQRALRLALPTTPAQVRITWAGTMGLRYPCEADTTLPEPDPSAATPGNSALVEATAAHRSALQAGIDHAVAEAALRAVTREIAETVQRRRAIEDRWIPGLLEALHATDLSLAELEHADAVRLRWAARQDVTPTGQEAP